MFARKEKCVAKPKMYGAAAWFDKGKRIEVQSPFAEWTNDAKRMLEAAPQMLEALQELFRLQDEGYIAQVKPMEGPGGRNAANEAWKAAYDAIKAAEGRDSAKESA